MNLGNMLGDLLRQRRRPRPPRPQTVISRHIGKAIAGVILAGGAALFNLGTPNQNESKKDPVQQVSASEPNAMAINAVLNHTELPFLEIKNAKVVQLLRADNRGARHQRWIVQLGSVPITVVHNIDLADKVPVSVGDEVNLGGELVFDQKKRNAILHWTHADPLKRRSDGYVEHLGKRYGDLQ